MAGCPGRAVRLRLLLDEHFSSEIARRLRKRGHDVIAVGEREGLRGRSDRVHFASCPPSSAPLSLTTWATSAHSSPRRCGGARPPTGSCACRTASHSPAGVSAGLSGPLPRARRRPADRCRRQTGRRNLARRPFTLVKRRAALPGGGPPGRPRTWCSIRLLIRRVGVFAGRVGKSGRRGRDRAEERLVMDQPGQLADEGPRRRRRARNLNRQFGRRQK